MCPREARLITAWMRRNLDGYTDPRLPGKPLTGDRAGQWRYRVGNYRILAEISDERVTILVLKIGDRKDIYND
ncbi:type II toxin-antitoxin system RelE/ParE family toxin [Cloacibacillus sp.]|uniref:type II toxin-antitoxin system RelE family toxin n=1 Tax=Cloacibacillus sp. TaxID=2049023 RepID=UPI0025BF31F9|nr:type II toxin-antitoxin system RelE/ParE family toxin [Cloacibacillus sp.]MCC8058694.1 type II toxin-antitoxin system RelE/ParE family toxin [Cloacibacillus sp.]MCC8178190.1 type II toxin-antitoxin system RelE/ParE family toxin [Cloacibacillus sp.]